ncbi:arf-GAP with SH3 domain, ANK repeat and PH domain-containing protein 2 [Scophthalmus maximus]|uniref:Un-named sa1614 n=1 Tax=Scophthalmus maximus TaxID=52904 RepID=A0A8D2ZTJ5_SCOMX|nr:arf-GAP with SH3 domain, ANK repeat and PH domain-containing protein 2 [Scophthalmus maximus]XP_047188550.1 arf-GAP with SH3 domain, ANK repeat and PH domain-containing protein 2 [Scophthalmus maximus]XP_047188551.1 arf-GAP with SH3 domain, ANK repeat and PH domain-containing protein 2 [Scophthalmus maximus]XP_047188552.1 arf-GAP with SH3 domain, ANK repeat and PH domain-containing protein 2 [Scophthalmus maximus]
MPECVSVSEFVQEVQEDWSSPTTSSFTAKMINCRNTVYLLEEALDSDRLVLQKMKKAAKAKYTSGQDHVCHLEQYIHSMEKLSLNCHSNGETEVGSAFCRLADFSKELVSPMKNLLKSMLHNINFFLDSVVKGDLREVKGDLKKPFDRSWRDYESRFKQIEKEKRELARQYGMVRTEVSGGEIAEELEKERRSFQLSMCEYLIKVNEIKTKRGVDLLQNLIKHYHSHNNFLQECVSTTQRLKQYMEELNGVLTTVKQRNEDEKRQLCSLRDQLRPAVPTEQQDSLPKQVYSMHQLLGDKQYGTERSGFLYKKSDGLRKMWQKRKCSVHNCYLTIAHATPNKPPTRLNLLTCQVKPSVEDKKCFDLISHNRTYHFLAEDEAECVAWISVLSNSKQEALSVALDGGRRGAGGGESSVEDLTRTITDDIRRMPGNTNCCDCGAPDPGWLSTNLGILTCIECSGIHREMGVHVSRIHSLNLDSLGTSDLLLARNVGNSGFNEILEANLLSPSLKPSQHSHMAERKDFILLKYQDVHFVRRSHSSNAALRLGLQEATKSCDIYSLIQLHAQRTELSQPLHTHIQEKGETAIHLAVLLADRTSLHILDFLAQNCSNVDMQTTAGNTALHYSCLHNKSDCVKLLLRARANTHIKNELGETALDVSRKLKHSHCEALLQQAQSNQFDHHVHVEYEWRLRHDDLYDSDDDFDDKNGPVKKERTSSSSSSFTSSFSFTSRPFSFSQSVAPPSSAAPGAPGGGLLSVGRRLAMAMDLHSRTSGTAPSPPPPPPSSPAPPLPPRVKAPSVPPPPPPAGGEGVGGGEEEEEGEVFFAPPTGSRKSTTAPPIAVRHKRSCSESNTNDYGLPTSPRIYGGPDSSFKKCVPSSPLSSLTERPHRGFRRADSDGSSSHFLHPAGKAPPNGSPTNHRSQSFESDGRGPAPQPLPRRSVPRGAASRRVQALYDCQADHHDELSFTEGQVLVVLGQDDCDWWHGYIEDEPDQRGLFPSSFVQLFSD